jgi:glycine betaine catabolism B
MSFNLSACKKRMAENENHNRIGQAYFAFFVWQSDLLREITPREAEQFFAIVNGSAPPLTQPLADLTQSYPKHWRDYVKHGPLPPLELSLIAQQIDDDVRVGLVQMLSAVHRAASFAKRRQTIGISKALTDLLSKDDNALMLLQGYYRKSRFFQDSPNAADSAVAPVPLPQKIESPKLATQVPLPAVAPVDVVKSPPPPVAKSTTLSEPSISMLKMVPWTEHDAVSPEKLQFWTKGSRSMRCIGIIDRTKDFKSFQFMSEEPTLFFFKPGQFVTMEVFVDGKRYLRSYTISSSPSRPHLLEVSIKRVKGGIVSNYLHDHLTIGDTIVMKPPGGKFHCFDAVTDKYLFLAAGSGITPMLSMARWWHDTGAHPDVIFYHSVREPEDAAFTEDMITFTSANRNFRYIASFTSRDLPDTWPGMKGRLNEERLFEIAPDVTDRMVFTCGPDSFMKNVRLILEKHSFPIKERFRNESFGSPNAKKTTAPSAASTPTATAAAGVSVSPRPTVRPAAVQAGAEVVHFSLSALEVFGGDMDITLLDLAEEVGVEIPSSCRSGTCGTCRAMKVKGEVESDDAPGLTDADREAGYVLTCVSRPRNYVEIEV